MPKRAPLGKDFFKKVHFFINLIKSSKRKKTPVTIIKTPTTLSKTFEKSGGTSAGKASTEGANRKKAAQTSNTTPTQRR